MPHRSFSLVKLVIGQTLSSNPNPTMAPGEDAQARVGDGSRNGSAAGDHARHSARGAAAIAACYQQQRISQHSCIDQAGSRVATRVVSRDC